MASNPKTNLLRIFIDSSVLMAAAISPRGFARDLVLAGFHSKCILLVSTLVLTETERNLLRKAPAAHAAFVLFRELLGAHSVDPTTAQVLAVAEHIHLKDAPIVAAAVAAQADYLATYDRKHLLNQAAVIAKRLSMKVVTPDEVISRLVPE